MRQQLTPEAVTMLVGALIVFWATIVTMVRVHGRRRSRGSATETRG